MSTRSSLVFLGDVYLPHPVDARVDLDGELVVNLEGPITRRGTPAPGKVNLRMEENHLRETFGRAPRAACLANNHVLDYGTEGFEDTLRALEEAGIGWFGAGAVEEGCGNPLVLEVGETRVALLGYSSAVGSIHASPGRPGVAPLAVERIAADIACAREKGARRVVVCLHWGAEFVPLPRPGALTTARKVVAAGADLIVGHHAHCIQALERVGGTYVFYGLGNCIFPRCDVPAFYDATGHAISRYMWRPDPWSRRSLGVRYDPASGEVKAFLLKCARGRLQLVKRGLERHVTSLAPGAAYRRRYRAAYLWGKLRRRGARFIAHPHLPRPVGLRRKAALWRRNLWKE